jgi:hypothetical protein
MLGASTKENPLIRDNRKLAVLALVVAGLLFMAGCGKDTCEGACECIGNECVCPAAGDCLIDCTADCDLQCAGSGDCDFLCGPGCLASCTGSGLCVVSIGDDSTVRCTGSGGCDVDCDGDCLVTCPGSGTCIARCEPGYECDIDSCSGGVLSCPDDVLVCNGPCPAR